MENASRIGAATDISDHRLGQSATLVRALFPAFLANHALELSNNPREELGANHRTQDVMRFTNRTHPISHGFVGGILEGSGPQSHPMDGRGEHSHAEDIEPLLTGILFTPLYTSQGSPNNRPAGGCGGHAVPARTPGLRNDSPLAHAFGQQGLPDGVVDLVGTGVGQVFSFKRMVAPPMTLDSWWHGVSGVARPT